VNKVQSWYQARVPSMSDTTYAIDAFDHAISHPLGYDGLKRMLEGEHGQLMIACHLGTHVILMSSDSRYESSKLSLGKKDEM
jgi:hypothetical protein